MPRKGSPYGRRYQNRRRAMLGLPCEMRMVCDGAPSTSGDHVPPLSRHIHVEGSGCCVLRPGCAACQERQRRDLAGETAHLRAKGVLPPMWDVPVADLPVPSRLWA